MIGNMAVVLAQCSENDTITSTTRDESKEVTEAHETTTDYLAQTRNSEDMRRQLRQVRFYNPLYVSNMM